MPYTAVVFSFTVNSPGQNGSVTSPCALMKSSTVFGFWIHIGGKKPASAPKPRPKFAGYSAPSHGAVPPQSGGPPKPQPPLFG